MGQWGFSFLILFFSFSSHAVWNGDPARGAFSAYSVRIAPNSRDRNVDEDLICSAVAYRPNMIITAAHCIENLSRAFQKKIRVDDPAGGRSDLVRVESVVLHPQYRLGFRKSPAHDQIHADLAVIKLADNYFSTSPLAIAKTRSNEVFLSASGVFSRKEMLSSNKELAVQLNTAGPGYFSVYSKKIAASPCESDSGGGYFSDLGGQVFLVAIQSSKVSGADCGTSEAVSFAPDLSQNLDWIVNINAE